MPTITIDAIAGLSVDTDDYFNECRTLQMLSTGLTEIADNLKRREAAWEQETAGKFTLYVYGSDIDGTKGNLDLTACFFHWFGVSVCNFARLVGFIHGLAASDFTRADLGDGHKFKSVRKSVKSYVDNVSELSKVLEWRHKVGAHFAITAPEENDNVSTLDMSVMFPVTFSNGRYRVGEWTLRRSNASGTHTSSIPSWSVTEVFDRLIPRYWPHIGLPSESGLDDRH